MATGTHEGRLKAGRMAFAKLVAGKPLTQADRCALEKRQKAMTKARKNRGPRTIAARAEAGGAVRGVILDALTDTRDTSGPNMIQDRIRILLGQHATAQDRTKQNMVAMVIDGAKVLIPEGLAIEIEKAKRVAK
jgi:hypothetical protein